MKRFVYNPKYAKLLVGMTGETLHIDELARRCGANTGHLRIVIDQLHKEGIINRDKPGISYKIRLTKKGEAVCIKLAELMELDEHWKEPEDEEPKDPSAEQETDKSKDEGGNKNE